MNNRGGSKESCSSCQPRGFFDKYGYFVKLGIVVFTPILLLPIPLVFQSSVAKATYTLALVAVYWTTEALPLGITALIPMVLFPMFGIIRSKELCLSYMKENILLFMAGYMVAMTIEKWNLHKRIALKVLNTIGSTPSRLILGFMLATMLLSMWISNTATTTMMIPIVEAVLQQLKKHYATKKNENPMATVEMENTAATDNGSASNGAVEPKSTTPIKGREEIVETKDFKNLCKAMCLCVAYASCFGGSSTLIGTGAVVIGKQQIDEVFEKHGLDSGITFPKWMAFVFPCSIVSMASAWLWLQFYWVGFRNTISALCGSKTNPTATEGVKKVLLEEYEKLGPIKFAEKGVICHFVVYVLLLFTRDLGSVDGWSAIFKPKYIGTSVPALLVVILLFIFPAYPFWRKGAQNQVNDFEATNEETDIYLKYVPLLDMKTVARKMAWNIVLLMGGGMALAKGCQESGLSDYLGEQMSALQSIPTWLLVGIVCVFLSFFTEFTSNVAVVSIIMPVLSQMAIGLRVNPLYLMIPGNIACLYAFMLPVATPPNAIVFSYGHLKVYDMVSSGFIMNMLCIAILTLASNTLGDPIFGFKTLPDALVQEVSTTAPNTTAPFNF